ncbi:pilus assembly protein PilM [Candidatus Pacebacteria bacterium]|nr:pilus assembly protein PilM [Candidatus Paceibacterota bacterium]
MSVLATLGNFIPPPSYITMPSIGVDISDTSLKYIQFAMDNRSGTTLELQQWGDIDIPDGVLKRGDIKDVQKLAEALKEVKKETGVQNVRVSLPEERAYLFETEIKKDTPFKEIRGLLEFRLEENVPLSPRDAFFDYDIVEDDLQLGVYRVLVTAYSRDTVMGYYEACKAAAVTPLAFEVEAQAIARATLPKGDVGTYMIVDFGKTRTGVGIVHRGALMYTSTIDIGGNELSTALRHQLGEKKESELTEIKNAQGLVRGVNDSSAYDALVTTMSAIKDEIATRIQYWNTRDVEREERQIEKVILCGGSVNLKGLPGYFTETLGIEAKRAEVWNNAFDINQTVPPIGRRYSYGYATAIGLALTNFT